LVYVPIAAGLVAAFCWGTADYFSRSQSEKLGYYRTVIYSNFVTLLALVALIPVVDPHLVLSVAPVLVLAAGGAVNLVAFVFLYRAFHRGVVSIVAPVAYTYPAVTAVLSVAILGAAISSEQFLALAAIITGVILLSTRFSQLRAFLAGRGPPNLMVGVGSALGSSALFGTVYVGIGYAAPLVSLAVPAIMLRAATVSLGFILAPFLKQDAKPTRLAFSNKIIAMGLLETVGWLSFTYGIESTGGSLPIVVAVAGMGGAVATSYGLVFLKERLDPNQIVGVLLALLGVFALLYLGG
jgi:drug/metabolite transporter (DMT)-like permease